MFDFLAETLASDRMIKRSGSTPSAVWNRPAPGVIVFEPVCDYTQNIIISAAIHGNETAPVEIMGALISDLLANKYSLKVRLMVIFGNIEAMRKGERYLNIDLNRLFSGHYVHYPDRMETQRAATLQQVVADFYGAAKNKFKLHFDLHTAIKPSYHATFGLLPYLPGGHYDPDMIAWLQSIGLDALVVNHTPAATFSYFTSNEFGVSSCTLELGKAQPFGHNDLLKFERIRIGLVNLVLGQTTEHHPSSALITYKVSQVLIKQSEQFKLHIDDNAENFSEFPEGFILASDQNIKYRVNTSQGYILFPNNDVKIGFRAGLLLEKVALSSIT
jgi:succinylglutamate desuccinylase